MFLWHDCHHIVFRLFFVYPSFLRQFYCSKWEEICSSMNINVSPGGLLWKILPLPSAIIALLRTEYTQSGNGVHSIMIEKSALVGESGDARSHPITLFTIASKVAVYSPAERADTLRKEGMDLWPHWIHYPYFISTLYVLCGYKRFSHHDRDMTGSEKVLSSWYLLRLP